MNEANIKVLTNVIGAVESGGQVYGKRRYDAYDPPYKNSEKEHTITIGWAQCYGHEARELMRGIFEADPEAFRKIDKNGQIEGVLKWDWVSRKWNPTAAEKAIIISIIDSPVGHSVQDSVFAEKMKALIADCAADYTDDVKAQMMYCEIRHLGGKTPCNRIFNRCNGKYDLDTIMAALARDQQDKSSDNQVGDTRYWSRHVKCRQFIDQYAVEEGVEYVGVVIGSARGDEYGNASGGKAGDQKQTAKPDYKGEVSRQSWYLHSKGWVVVRAKDAAAREKIAQDMEYACDNPLIGYDQGENESLFKVAKPLGFDCSKVDKPCETDCARLVRVCVSYAGIKSDVFYTASLAEKLKATGAFDVITTDKFCKSSDYLMRGDILVTKTKGHTVVVLSDGTKAGRPAETTVADSTTVVKAYQHFLNANYAQILKSYCGELLLEDGDYGKKTRAASVTVWKYMANKYYGGKLTLGNANFLSVSQKIASLMTDQEIYKHPTLGFILQGVLAGRSLYRGTLDGKIGAYTVAAIKDFQKLKNISASGSMTGTTWRALFN